jgi:general secretion pathway protein M
MAFALPTGWTGRVLAVTFAALAVLIVWLGVVSPLTGLYDDRAAELARARTLADKMSEMATTLPRLKADAASRANAASPPSLLLPGGSDALAAAGLQETLTKLASATGIELLSAEGTPVQSVGAVRRIGLKINVAGKYSALVAFLSRVDQTTPPLLLDELQIQGLAQQRGAHTITRLTVYGFRAGDKGT